MGSPRQDGLIVLDPVEGEIFSSYLRRVRLARGLLQLDVAVQIGASRTQVGMWERGCRIPRPVWMSALAMFLGLSEAQVCGLTGRGCGTRRGYDWHCWIGQKPCDACSEAYLKYQREWRQWRTGAKPRQPAECGTSGGLARHYRLGEKPCDACLEARREYTRKNWGKFRKPQSWRKVADCGTPSGYNRHYRLGEKPCDACREVNRLQCQARYLRRRKMEQEAA